MSAEKKIFGTEYSWNDPPPMQFMAEPAKTGGRSRLNQRVAHNFTSGCQGNESNLKTARPLTMPPLSDPAVMPPLPSATPESLTSDTTSSIKQSSGVDEDTHIKQPSDCSPVQNVPRRPQRTVLLTAAGSPPPEGNIIFNPTGGQARTAVSLLPPTPPAADQPHDVPLLLPTLNESLKDNQLSSTELVQKHGLEKHLTRLYAMTESQQAISVQGALLACLRGVETQLQARHREDISRRLEALHQMWIEHKLSVGVSQSMIKLAAALDIGLFDLADECHISLMCNHVTEVSQWMVGIKRLIHAARKVPPVNHLFIPSTSVKSSGPAIQPDNAGESAQTKEADNPSETNKSPASAEGLFQTSEDSTTTSDDLPVPDNLVTCEQSEHTRTCESNS